MGTAVLLSVLFTLMPTNISAAMQNESDLKSALNAAMTPSVANASKNQGVMDEIWTKIVDPVQQNVQDGLDQGTAQAKQAADAAVTKQVTAAVQRQVAAGTVPAAAADTIIAQQVDDAKPAAEQQALETAATKANASVVDGKLQIDYSDRAQRENVVDQVAPALVKQLKSGDSAANSSTDSATSDTSFLNGADPRLSRPFLVGFSDSAVRVYYVGLAVILLAFVLTWFFRVPPLRKTSALQEQADAARTADAAAAAPGAGPEPTVPGASSRDVPTSPDVTPQPRSARAPGAPDGADDTRAPLPNATTHGAHSAAAPVDEPPTTTGAIRTRAAHAATAVEPDAPGAAADAAEASRASRPDADDVHAHGRRSAE
ncbi:hypothetical protein [Curtobacterium poinsettiae]|uniref:hypothetical protein n=1 Tax=Curtobacterium poinsettiae TaxID=159612 RepID=UPI0037BFA38F